MKSVKQFDCFMSDCCKDKRNLTYMNRSTENDKEYLWLKCEQCGNVVLKTMEFKDYEEKESV